MSAKDATVAIEIALADTIKAQEEFRLADVAESLARNRRSEALNRLNAAQKKLDGLMAEIRKSAPAGTEWSTAERDARRPLRGERAE